MTDARSLSYGRGTSGYEAAIQALGNSELMILKQRGLARVTLVASSEFCLRVDISNSPCVFSLRLLEWSHPPSMKRAPFSMPAESCFLVYDDAASVEQPCSSTILTAHHLPHECISLTGCFFSTELNGAYRDHVSLALACLGPIGHNIYGEPLTNHKPKHTPYKQSCGWRH